MKSMLLADLAVCVAAGLPWLSHPANGGGQSTTQAPVLWADFDNGQRRTHERFAALGRARELPETTPLYYVSMPDPHLDAGNPDAMDNLARRIEARGVRLVIIDNLGVIVGDADENSAEMQAPMRGLRQLAERTGAAVVVIHHQRKAGPYGSEKRIGETLRGHGSIEAKIDLALLATRPEGGQTLTLTPTKMRGAPVAAIAAKFAYENDANHELLTARFWSADTPDEKAEARATTIAKVVEALQGAGKPLSKNQLFARVGGNREFCYSVLGQMLLARQIDVSDGPRGSQMYSLTEQAEKSA